MYFVGFWLVAAIANYFATHFIVFLHDGTAMNIFGTVFIH